ncbi:MAG: hypothetical protein ABSH47_24010 [Bryobacteraceae bacterium]|jgi:hypothetical protein
MRYLELPWGGGVRLSRDSAIRVFATDPELQKRLAKYMVLQCFRNSLLEDLHSGITPSSGAGDYSDVHVTTPYGEIPWSRLSRLSDEEMKGLMIDVVNRTYRFLHQLLDENTGAEMLVRLTMHDPLPNWSTPILASDSDQGPAGVV